MSQKLDGKARRRGAPALGSSPDYRWNAVPSSERVSVLTDAVSWEGGDDPAARLSVTVHVRESEPHTRVWLDVYAFDGDGALVGFDTYDLQHAEAVEAGGNVFALDAPVWGPDLRPTSVGPSPAPRKLKYRVYVRPDAGLFTDGMLHDVALPGLRARKGRSLVPKMEPRSAAG
jgi:hypothetical protein